MTEDPVRLIELGGAASSLERELLLSLRGATPPSGSQSRVWDSLSKQIAIAGVVGGSLAATKSAAAAGTAHTTGQAAALVTKLSLGKWALGFVLGAAGIGVAVTAALHTSATGEGIAASSATASEGLSRAQLVSTSMPAPSAVEAPCASCNVPAPEEPPPRRSESKSPSQTELDLESRLLVRARAALRSGDVRGTQAALTELDQKVPRGMLGQEREVLEIELLAARGKDAAARVRAERFMGAHPNSPHSKNLERFLRAP